MRTKPPAKAVPPSEAVVSRIANAEGIDQEDLVPLYDTIDPDALDTLSEDSGRDQASLKIEFTHHGYDVTVTSRGAVRVEKGEEGSP